VYLDDYQNSQAKFRYKKNRLFESSRDPKFVIAKQIPIVKREKNKYLRDMMDHVELRHDVQIGDTDKSANVCDSKKFLLKKNLSWTHSATISSNNNNNNNNINFSHVNNSISLAKSKSLRISRSNPHVLECLSSSVRLKLPSLQQISNRFNSQALSPMHSNGRIRKLAPLAKAISFTSTGGATNQTANSTPTAIQFNALQRNNFRFCCKVQFSTFILFIFS
jgi:hypothetical protein